jgi:hypothetical protein
LKPKQLDFKHTVEAHLYLAEINGATRRSCKCERILKLIDWYFEAWFAGEKLTSSERVETLDSARINEEGIELIASVVEGYL